MKYILLFIALITNTMAVETYKKHLDRLSSKFYGEFVDHMANTYSFGYILLKNNHHKFDKLSEVFTNEKRRQDFQKVLSKMKVSSLPRPLFHKRGIAFKTKDQTLLMTPEGFVYGFVIWNGKKVFVDDRNPNFESSIQSLVKQSVIKKKEATREFSFLEFVNPIDSAHANYKTINDQSLIMAILTEFFYKDYFVYSVPGGRFREALSTELLEKHDPSIEQIANYGVDKYGEREFRFMLRKNINLIYEKAKYLGDACEDIKRFIENGADPDNDPAIQIESITLNKKIRLTDRFIHMWLHFSSGKGVDAKQWEEDKKTYNHLMKQFLLFDVNWENKNDLSCKDLEERHPARIVENKKKFEKNDMTKVDLGVKVAKNKEIYDFNPCRHLKRLAKCIDELDQKDNRRVLESLSRQTRRKDGYLQRNAPELEQFWEYGGYGENR
ncbi:hypothetical protein HBN50_04365 [Halobacteriovorax sp. GB3]|uniref:hypothetical protein n=1 Tax=Halobacteriovorax sp. GB3 TaxID=2719615 RepID=UPI002362AEB7|nr:hypothetical protein [Halobacteriovorax sp. GB3]MDD0852316.1 hypothetical protein [Halobacteriovorax sp. GB3]